MWQVSQRSQVAPAPTIDPRGICRYALYCADYIEPAGCAAATSYH